LNGSDDLDSSPEAPRRTQTGHNPLSLVAENFVPQDGQVRISRGANPAFFKAPSTLR
jgi:hypothetical protein